MKEFKFFVDEVEINGIKQKDFNLYNLPTNLIPDLVKALNQELFIRSSKVRFADERAKFRDNLGFAYSLTLFGSHVDFEG
jgi:hypothetical protein